MHRTKHIIVAGLLLSASGPALAQAASSADDQPETGPDIIVTAQKRDQRLTDVPIAISVATGEQLAQQGVRTPGDLEKIVPGFTFTRSSFGNPVFTVRGIGLYDTAVGVSPTVTVYSDQVPLPFLAMTNGVALDVARVEVLKGPQGTVFGQNSTGGAINYIAAKPTAAAEAGFDVSYGRFDRLDASGFVSGPLSETLGARLAVRHERADGWQKSLTRPDDDLGGVDFTQGRLILDFRPLDTVSAEFIADGWINKSETQAGQFIGYIPSRPDPLSGAALGGLRPAPTNARAADWDPGFDLRRDDWLYRLSARIDAEVSSAVTLTSITSYSRFSADVPADADGTAFPDFQTTVFADVKSFFQELRAAADIETLKLTAGLNYQDDRIDETRSTFFQASSGILGPFRFTDFDNVSDQASKTYSAFGNAEFEIVPRLRIEGGIRYSKQDRDFSGCLYDGGDGKLATIAFAVGSGVPGSSLRPPVPGQCVSLIQSATGISQQPIITDALNEDNISWRAGVNFKPTPRSLLYASVSRGYKAGTYTPLPALFAVQLRPAVQESVLAYEVGAKGLLADGVIEFSGALFHYDYTDKQILGQTVIAGLGIPVPQLVNVPKSKVTGAEGDVTLRPMSGLSLRGGVAYVDTSVDGAFQTTNLSGAAINIDGMRFPLTPRWQASASANYAFPFGDRLSASLGANLTYRSRTTAAFGRDAPSRIDPYTIVGLRAGIGAADDRWRVELWGENIFNEYYWTNVYRAPDTVARLAAMPATYGLTIRTRLK